VKVLLVRHATAAAPPGAAVGWGDVELAPAGSRQAEALAGRLEAGSVERLYSSDLRRAMQTASILAGRLGLPILEAPELRELDFGAWEGRRLADLWAERPDEARAWESDLRRLPSGFGETFESFESRVAAFAARLQAESGDALVVAHRGPLLVLYALLTGTCLQAAWRLPFELGSVTEVELGC
jgi:broad specificity phosphatase PhoE